MYTCTCAYVRAHTAAIAKFTVARSQGGENLTF